MSRAMNLSLPEAEVRAHCQALAVAISAIEPLPAGGTHLVCVASEGAQIMRDTYHDKLILKPVRRFAFYRAH